MSHSCSKKDSKIFFYKYYIIQVPCKRKNWSFITIISYYFTYHEKNEMWKNPCNIDHLRCNSFEDEKKVEKSVKLFTSSTQRTS